MLAHSCLKRIRHISQHTRRRMILRIHSYKACGSWSIPSKLLVAILIRPAARLLREPHTAARRLLAVFAGHEAVLLEATTGLAATLSGCLVSWSWASQISFQVFKIIRCTWNGCKSRRLIYNKCRRRRRGRWSGRRHYSSLRIFTAFQPS